jgi:hypothetical protein
MTDATRLLTTVSLDLPIDGTQVAEAIDALRGCALACTTCADACLGEDHAEEMRSCIRACTTCADLCDVTARLLARTGGYDLPVLRNVLEAAAKACGTCGEICDRHAAVHKHCRLCEEACRRCEQAIQQLLAALAGATV